MGLTTCTVQLAFDLISLRKKEVGSWLGCFVNGLNVFLGAFRLGFLVFSQIILRAIPAKVVAA